VVSVESILNIQEKEFYLNKRNWRQVEGLVPNRRPKADEIERELKRMQDR
jgi:hypothetical protein